jgi:hypothetical protein
VSACLLEGKGRLRMGATTGCHCPKHIKRCQLTNNHESEVLADRRAKERKGARRGRDDLSERQSEVRRAQAPGLLAARPTHRSTLGNDFMPLVGKARRKRAQERREGNTGLSAERLPRTRDARPCWQDALGNADAISGRGRRKVRHGESGGDEGEGDGEGEREA